MQMNTIDAGQLAELLTDAQIHDTLDHDGQLIHVLTYTGNDIIAITNPITGGAVVVYPPEAFDAEDGSVHDQARELLGAKV